VDDLTLDIAGETIEQVPPHERALESAVQEFRDTAEEARKLQRQMKDVDGKVGTVDDKVGAVDDKVARLVSQLERLESKFDGAPAEQPPELSEQERALYVARLKQEFEDAIAPVLAQTAEEARQLMQHYVQQGKQLAEMFQMQPAGQQEAHQRIRQERREHAAHSIEVRPDELAWLDCDVDGLPRPFDSGGQAEVYRVLLSEVLVAAKAVDLRGAGFGAADKLKKQFLQEASRPRARGTEGVGTGEHPS
jgi:hypothetical protein